LVDGGVGISSSHVLVVKVVEGFFTAADPKSIVPKAVSMREH
jgi:hypothetical protein